MICVDQAGRGRPIKRSHCLPSCCASWLDERDAVLDGDIVALAEALVIDGDVMQRILNRLPAMTGLCCGSNVRRRILRGASDTHVGPGSGASQALLGVPHHLLSVRRLSVSGAAGVVRCLARHTVRLPPQSVDTEWGLGPTGPSGVQGQSPWPCLEPPPTRRFHDQRFGFRQQGVLVQGGADGFSADVQQDGDGEGGDAVEHANADAAGGAIRCR